MTDLFFDTAVQQLHAFDGSVRLIVIHPNYVPQHLLLQEFMQDAAFVYVRFEGKRVQGDQLRQQFETALIEQLGQARLDGIKTVVLDECDRVIADDLDDFMREIVRSLDGGRAVVISRAVPPCVFDEELRPYARFVPFDDGMMLWDYARHDGDKALLEVRALGVGRVCLNGRLIDNWDGLLPRSLFYYLVDRGMTTRADIFQTFWPTLSTREATNVFHVTKRKISEVLGIDLTVYWTGFYCIAPNIDLSYDVAQFKNLLQQSEVAPDEEIGDLLRRGVSLYQEDFLKTINMEWAAQRRQELYQHYGDALVGLARAMERADRPYDALGLYIRASATNRQREDIAQNIMRLYLSMGRKADALATYKRLEHELRTKLGVDPSPPLQDLLSDLDD